MKIQGFEIRWPQTVVACNANPPYDGSLLRGPHCDPLVLHGPASGCDYCAAYTEAINERINLGINFTGEAQAGRTACPAEQQRPLAVIHAWPGNRPLRKELTS